MDKGWRLILAGLMLHDGKRRKIDKEQFKREVSSRLFKIQLAFMLIPFAWFMISMFFGRDLVPSIVATTAGMRISFILEVIKIIKRK